MTLLPSIRVKLDHEPTIALVCQVQSPLPETDAPMTPVVSPTPPRTASPEPIIVAETPEPVRPACYDINAPFFLSRVVVVNKASATLADLQNLTAAGKMQEDHKVCDPAFNLLREQPIGKG